LLTTHLSRVFIVLITMSLPTMCSVLCHYLSVNFLGGFIQTAFSTPTSLVSNIDRFLSTRVCLLELFLPSSLYAEDFVGARHKMKSHTSFCKNSIRHNKS